MKFQTSQTPWQAELHRSLDLLNVCLCYHWKFVSMYLLLPEVPLRAASLGQVTVLLNSTKCKSISFPRWMSMVPAASDPCQAFPHNLPCVLLQPWQCLLWNKNYERKYYPTPGNVKQILQTNLNFSMCLSVLRIQDYSNKCLFILKANKCRYS